MDPIFGKTSIKFHIDSSGYLNYSGDTKTLNKDPKKAFKGLKKIIKDKITTNVYEGKSAKVSTSKGELTLTTESYGGAVSYVAKENDDKGDNHILIDKNASNTLLVEEITDAYGLETRYPKDGPYVNPHKEIKTSIIDRFFHEIGEILHKR